MLIKRGYMASFRRKENLTHMTHLQVKAVVGNIGKQNKIQKYALSAKECRAKYTACLR